jgi:hypothetical protein
MEKTSSLASEIKIKSWVQFEKNIEELKYRDWVFRGHTDASWQLKTSLYRRFDYIQNILELGRKNRKFARDKHEKLIIQRFKTNAHRFLNHLPENNDDLEWLSLIQHYGAPTRLLDFTLSPYIALYFALESDLHNASILAINQYLINKLNPKPGELQKKLFKNLKGKSSFILPYNPKFSSERLEAQQGLFLVPSNNYELFEDLLKAYFSGKSDDIGIFRKIIIPADLRFSGLEILRKMNITTSSLFPGLEGFCRSLNYQILETTKSLGNLLQSE